VDTVRLDLALEENLSGQLETDAVPSVGFGAWQALSPVVAYTDALEVRDGAGPVIRSAMLDDKGTLGAADDRILVEWSERIADVDSGLGANEVFQVWHPDSSQLVPDYLAGCGVEVRAMAADIWLIADKIITTDDWLNIDSSRSGICDVPGNATLKNNRKVRVSGNRSSSTVLGNSYVYPGAVDRDQVVAGSAPLPEIRLVLYEDAQVTVLIYDVAGYLVRKISKGRLRGLSRHWRAEPQSYRPVGLPKRERPFCEPRRLRCQARGGTCFGRPTADRIPQAAGAIEKASG
jgi:hypothetical protein